MACQWRIQIVALPVLTDINTWIILSALSQEQCGVFTHTHLQWNVSQRIITQALKCNFNILGGQFQRPRQSREKFRAHRVVLYCLAIHSDCEQALVISNNPPLRIEYAATLGRNADGSGTNCLRARIH